MSGLSIDRLIVWSVAACATPIAAGWLLQLRRAGPVPRRGEKLAILCLVTVSYAWLWVVYFWTPAFGSASSATRLATIGGNLAVDALVMVWTLARSQGLFWVLLLGAALTACCWLYVLVVNLLA